MFTQNITKLVVSLLAASQLVAARPHGHHIYKRGADVVVTVTKVAYVDQYGRSVDPNNVPPCTTAPVAVSTAPVVAAPTSTQAPAPPPVVSSSKAPEPTIESKAPEPTVESKAPKVEANAPEKTKAPEPTVTPTPIVVSSKAPEPTTQPQPVSGSGDSSKAIVYSPYHKNNKGAGRMCKEESEIQSDIQKLSGFGLLRLYSTDCDQVNLCLKYGSHKLFIGLENTEKPDNEFNDLVNAIKKNGGSWDRIDTVTLGNEVSQFGKYQGGNTAGYADAINAMRARLRAAGYQGSVVGADTFVSLMNDASAAICKASDYVAANAHPYFDGGVGPEEAGTWLINMEKAMQEKFASAGCTGKKIRFAETGWPTQGGSNGKAIPSVENQRIAINSIIKAKPDTILFTAFNDDWKEDTSATKGSEKYWGIAGIESVAALY